MIECFYERVVLIFSIEVFLRKPFVYFVLNNGIINIKYNEVNSFLLFVSFQTPQLQTHHSFIRKNL